MKKLIYGTLFLATVGITIMACKKELMSPSSRVSSVTGTTETSKEKGDLFSSPTDKSTGNGALDSMAQAANIAQIKYNSDGTYTIDSYDDTLTYNLLVTKFYEDSLIKFFISERTIVYTVIINVDSKSISISGVGSYTFANFYGTNGITATSGIIKNMVAVFTPYYDIYHGTNSWTDNGDGDVYKPEWRFWGWENHVIFGVDADGNCITSTEDVYYMLGIPVHHTPTSNWGPCEE